MQTRTGPLLAALTLMSLLGSASAHADDEPLSRQHFSRAMSLADLGDHRAAIKEFELAYQAKPRASILYNLAHEHQVLAESGAVDEMRRAVDFYQKYLEAQPKAPDRREVERKVVELRARIESSEADARQMPVTALPPPPEKAPVSDAPRTNDVPAAALGGTASSDEGGRRRTGLWIGLGVGVAVVAGVAVGLGVGLTRDNAPPDTTLGGVTGSFQ